MTNRAIAREMGKTRLALPITPLCSHELCFLVGKGGWLLRVCDYFHDTIFVCIYIGVSRVMSLNVR